MIFIPETEPHARHLWGRVYSGVFTTLYTEYFENGAPIVELEEEAASAADAAVEQLRKRTNPAPAVRIEQAPQVTQNQLREAAAAIFK